MAKVKSIFICQNCGAQSARWIGKCPSCEEWNSYVEEIVQRETRAGISTGVNIKSQPRLIHEVESGKEPRLPLQDKELSRVLGGGLVPGSVILVGGDPGIGKSTLLLQLAIRHPEFKSLYIAGEESEYQIRMRAERLGLKKSQTYLLSETKTQQIFLHLEELKPDLVIVDSVQTLQTAQLDSSPGSVSQIRECAAEIIHYAKSENVPVFLIGHITKDGSIAGPKVLEHMVDTVLQFEGERNHAYRLLRSLKNRFGSTNELGIYEMQGNGLREVDNPSEILLGPRDQLLSGMAVSAVMEGLRPMLLEIQALVSSAVYGTPQRSATGFDTRRLNMLLAVLEKRCGFKLGSKDVFLNVTGGIRVDEPAADLAVVTSVLSSAEDIPVDKGTAFAAEVGLSGELRPVIRVDQRINEAAKLGFSRIIISSYNKGITASKHQIEVVKLKQINEVFSLLFG